ncbi:MAG: hypothetical protein AAF433_19310 [Bacteroidota bacterium]
MKNLSNKELVDANGGFIIEIIGTVAAVMTIVYTAGAVHGSQDCRARCENN